MVFILLVIGIEMLILNWYHQPWNDHVHCKDPNLDRWDCHRLTIDNLHSEYKIDITSIFNLPSSAKRVYVEYLNWMKHCPLSIPTNILMALLTEPLALTSLWIRPSEFSFGIRIIFNIKSGSFFFFSIKPFMRKWACTLPGIINYFLSGFLCLELICVLYSSIWFTMFILAVCGVQGTESWPVQVFSP